MRISRYVMSVRVNENSYMLYSLKTRKYFLYNKENQKNLQKLIDNINKVEYTLKEVECIRQLIRKGILIADEENEIEELEYLENKAKYQNNELQMMVVVTNDCNFRCQYCVQEHERKNLTSDAEEKILKFIKNNVKIKRKIKISWFGGEPLLRFVDIKRILNDAIEYAKDYDCEIISDFTTNGYLLSSQIIQDMKLLNVESLQITLDGDRETHNKRRYLVGKGGTYDRVKENLIEALKNGIPIVLRINIDQENVMTATCILNEIPEQYRKNVIVNIANLYQAENKISTYEIYKKAIELGYQYGERKNQYVACHTCFSQGYIVDMDANMIMCANASEDRILGKINEKGNMCITNPKVFYQIKTASMVKNPSCQECIQLPFCVSTCKKSIYKENIGCHGKKANGLSVEEKAKLDYLYDIKCMKREETYYE